MKITKQRLQEIILEEMSLSESEVDLSQRMRPIKQTATLEPKAKLDKATARAGAKAARSKGTGLVRDVAAMTPLEGQIEARLQALHDELVGQGEIKNASRIKQIIDRVLQMVKQGEL